MPVPLHESNAPIIIFPRIITLLATAEKFALARLLPLERQAFPSEIFSPVLPSPAPGLARPPPRRLLCFHL
jgi:hypothetical protein